jgi:flavin reductase (DIM6/NTAB) family NADH-FMN oxidoreductase RutF
VVTAGDAGEVSCATSTTTYVSVRPSILTVALAPGSRTARLARRSGRFSVSVLAAGQADVAQRAGRRADGPDKLAAAGLRPEHPQARTDGYPI